MRIALAILVLLFVAPSTANAGAPHLFDEAQTRATSLARVEVCFDPGVLVSVRTGNLSHTWADPVMHILKKDSNGVWQEVYYDDDSYDGVNPSITWSTTGRGGCQKYQIIVRAYDKASGGNGGATFQLIFGPGYYGTTYPLGGYVLTSGDNYIGASESLRSVRVNEGASGAVFYHFTKTGGRYKFRKNSGVTPDWGEGTSELAGWNGGYGQDQWVVATPDIDEREGPVRVVRTGGTDTDGDGLPDLLEDALGTCQSASQSGCAGIDPMDTDSDGIKDSHEAIGIEDEFFPQELYRWGASPTHRDLFVEVDRKAWDGPHVGPSPSEPMLEQAAERFDALDIPNPDGDYGVHLHFDVDFDCINELGTLDGEPGDDDGLTALCGNYGGSSMVTEIPPASNGNPLSLSDIWLATPRKNLFHNAVATDGGTGQGQPNGHKSWFNTNQATDTVGELIAHELGHNGGLQHWGEPSTYKANQTPHYFSIMNYAYDYSNSSHTYPQFSDGSRQDLNPSNLPEANYSPGADISFWGRFPFNYTVSGNSVDWNRDGVISSSVQASVVGEPTANSFGDDNALARDQVSLPNTATDVGPGAAVFPTTDPGGQVREAIWMFRNDAVTHRFMYSKRYLEGPYKGLQTSWTSFTTAAYKPGSEPEVVRWDTSSGPRLLVFGVDSLNRIVVDNVQPFRSADDFDRVGTFRRHDRFRFRRRGWLKPLPGDPGRELSNLGAVDHADFDVSVVICPWSPLSSGGSQLRSRVQPGLAPGTDGRLYMLVKKDVQPRINRLDLYELEPSTGVWSRMNIPWGPLDSYVASGKPAFVWTLHRDGNGTPLSSPRRGAFRLWYNATDTIKEQVLTRFSTGTFAESSGPGFGFGMSEWRNAPTYLAYNCYGGNINGTSSALVSTDDGVQAIAVHLGKSEPTCQGEQLYVSPHADGVVDLNYVDTDDNSQIAAHLCSSIWRDQPCKCTDMSLSCPTTSYSVETSEVCGTP